MFTIFVLSGSVAKLSSSAISGKTKIYLFLINKIKFERVCLYKTCQNPVTTANHVRKTFILVIQSKTPVSDIHFMLLKKDKCRRV